MVSCVVMASGYSRRLGRDKLTLEYRGKTLIERTIERLKKTDIDEIIVVYRDRKVLKLVEKYGVKTVYNESSELGQSESIKIGVRETAPHADGYMFTVADQPFMKPETIESLIGIFKENGDRIVIPRSNGRCGNPVIFPSHFSEELLSLTGDTGGKAIIEKHSDRLEYVEVEENELFDIDTENDILVLEQEG